MRPERCYARADIAERYVACRDVDYGGSHTNRRGQHTNSCGCVRHTDRASAVGAGIATGVGAWLRTAWVARHP